MPHNIEKKWFWYIGQSLFFLFYNFITITNFTI